MQKLKKALLVFALLLLNYLLLRVLFYEMHFRQGGLSPQSLWTVFYWGFRLDLTAIFYSNLVFFIYYFLIEGAIAPALRTSVAVWLLAIINLPLLALNIIDLVYFKYNLRRSTLDLFDVLPDSFAAMGGFWKSWWWLVPLFFLLAFFLIRAARWILDGKLGYRALRGRDSFLKHWGPFLIFVLPIAVLARGWEPRPIMPSTPLLYIRPEWQPLASNSTISMMYSVVQKQSTARGASHFSDSRLDSLFTIRRQYGQGKIFQQKNVVVFILESFSYRLLDSGSAGKANTPFLDSLRRISINCERAYANGAESNKGIVALLGSIPPLLDEPFYYSKYNTDPFRGIGSLLGEKGYRRDFFMGASPDHFGFGKWCRMIGIDHYHSKKEYPYPEHDDGNWGIYDHYFLPWAARQIKAGSQPFFSVVFNISSHPPFAIPPALRAKFNLPGQTLQQQGVSYTDYSLRLFFEEIKREPWFNNTIFVFAADHTLFDGPGRPDDLYEYFHIPLFFYQPSAPVGIRISKTVQQLDVVPTILDMLNYPGAFMSFGNSVFDRQAGFAVNKVFDSIQLIDSSGLSGFVPAGDSLRYFYHYRQDPRLDSNLAANRSFAGDLAERKLFIRAFLQRFNQSLEQRKLLIR